MKKSRVTVDLRVGEQWQNCGKNVLLCDGRRPGGAALREHAGATAAERALGPCAVEATGVVKYHVADTTRAATQIKKEK